MSSEYAKRSSGDDAALHREVAELASAKASLSKELDFSRTANKFLSSVLDTVDALVVVVDASGRIVRLNQAFRQALSAPGQKMDGRYLWEMLLLPDDVLAIQTIIGRLQAKQCRTASASFWLTKSGNLRLISWSFTVLHGSGDEGDYIVGVGLDVTEREQAEENLRINKERYQVLFNSVNDAVFVYSLAKGDQRSRLIEVNEVACERLGYRREELIKLSPADIERPLITAQIPLIDHKLRQQKHALFEAVHLTKTGEEIPVEVNAHLFSLYGQPTVLSVARDITERKELEEKLRFITMHDSLTGLYNRAYFDEEVRRLEAARELKVGIVGCDVDGLKLINDSMGHQAGDALLRAAAAAIASAVREGDFVARVGGDEFVVLLYNIDATGVKRVMDRIRAAIAKQNGAEPGLPLSISLGCAVATEDTKDIHQLLKEADDHMYREKLHHSKSARSMLVHGLKKALEARDFITDGHGERLMDLIDKLGRTIGLDERDMAELRLLAQFHDFGKVGVPDRILFKPGRLTEEEYAEMQRHSEIGHRIAQSVPDLCPIADRILKHHEWWNGQGCPLGLAGEDIPLECRILSIADAYDAMTSDRPYRKAMPPEDALKELQRFKGRQFDPLLVDKFINVLNQ
ncbi:diguanylate cyclase domain-containing protein [Anaeroselena agilis]|uniref:Diguanylate cyclase n=1 Tax=Anaeroselena agilis TaxID=3063788 RepID=A0ABU3P3P7_9FIRM|nr:diguanylate cyclase [Selenomonadales bacterium 4137-cl]